MQARAMTRCNREEATVSKGCKRRVSRYLLATAAPVAIGFLSTSPASALTCSQLATNFHRPNTTITTAQTVPAGRLTRQVARLRDCRLSAGWRGSRRQPVTRTSASKCGCRNRDGTRNIFRLAAAASVSYQLHQHGRAASERLRGSGDRRWPSGQWR